MVLNNFFKPLVVLGSSSCEVFDYIFGANDNYYPFWAGAWNARNLIDDNNKIYLKSILEDISRDANIFLGFGAIDIDFVLSVKYAHGFRDYEIFAHEISNGISRTVKYLKEIGFINIYVTLVYLPVDEPDEYWRNEYNIQPCPIEFKAKTFETLHNILLNDIDLNVISAIDPLKSSDGLYKLDNQFKREKSNNHADYIKIQDIVWNAIKDIDDILPHRNPKHTRLYPFHSTIIGDIMHNNTVRKRTCR
ncbi:hypothetical protein [Moraxella boevrei]|uniref:hypothetical protein n=1 Tax=Faucicola boevrei TaxID=346665 RepID=UPI003736D31B